MDQIKIGSFIQDKRKEKNITQSELAEKLGITDRAVSKWERGICLPDSGIIQDLCNILDITINDLFSGEVVDMKDNERKLEENLIEMTKLKEEKDKMLLRLEIVIGILLVGFFMGIVIMAATLEMPEWVRLCIVIADFAMFLVATFYMLAIEQKAGYYMCKECQHKYVPTYKSVFKARHIGRSRKMVCPNCGKKTWHKKVLK